VSFRREDPLSEIFRSYPISKRNVSRLFLTLLTLFLSVKQIEGRDFLIHREEILQQQQQTLDWLQENWVEMRKGSYLQVSRKNM